ncbi:hypothetical protein A8G00_02565 [Sphingobium sp. SA916]|nr:hypothetical protein A8G00_02565 [Sphingobium sp. SA916]
MALQVECAQQRRFLLRIDGERAIIRLGTMPLLLKRRGSSLGQRFGSEDALMTVVEMSHGEISWFDTL